MYQADSSQTAVTLPQGCVICVLIFCGLSWGLVSPKTVTALAETFNLFGGAGAKPLQFTTENFFG